MHLTYINITTLSINHINNISTHRTKQPQHRIYVVHPSVGLRPPTLLLLLLDSSNLLTCTEPQIQLHIGQEICVHLARSSFPKLGPSTKPYTFCAQKHYKTLALSSASLNTQYAQSIHNYFHLAH
jgi:hypothetical protein